MFPSKSEALHSVLRWDVHKWEEVTLCIDAYFHRVTQRASKIAELEAAPNTNSQFKG